MDSKQVLINYYKLGEVYYDLNNLGSNNHRCLDIFDFIKQHPGSTRTEIAISMRLWESYISNSSKILLRFNLIKIKQVGKYKEYYINSKGVQILNSKLEKLNGKTNKINIKRIVKSYRKISIAPRRHTRRHDYSKLS